MGWAFAFIFGVIGAVLAAVLRANLPPQHDGAQDFLLFLLSGVFTVPLGYFIGEAIEKVQQNKQALAEKPVKQFPRQLTGSKCEVCAETILMAEDGRRCESCQAALHHDCSAKHVCSPK